AQGRSGFVSAVLKAAASCRAGPDGERQACVSPSVQRSRLASRCRSVAGSRPRGATSQRAFSRRAAASCILHQHIICSRFQRVMKTEHRWTQSLNTCPRSPAGPSGQLHRGADGRLSPAGRLVSIRDSFVH
uniref:Uncharacterized protein n=1 Tax=Salarias fasciatus TaxID=181472 RepID=A0A672GBH0_SALFA